MDVTALRFLLRPPGQRLLEAATAAYDERDALALAGRLRRLGGGYTAEQVAAAMTQAALRRSAAAKFGAAASGMYFTSAGLQQATAPAVAAHRAERAAAAAGDGEVPVLDLCCGIGADLLAFARSGLSVTGVELDEVTAEVATANLAASGMSGRVLCTDATTMDTKPYDVAFVDPSRRRGGTNRVFDPSAYSPPWSFVDALLTSAATDGLPGRRVVVKLAPGLDHALIPVDAEAEWVSLDGELKETTLWGPAPTAVRRRATVLSTTGTPAERTTADAMSEPPPVAAVGEFVYEPDPAVIRAHLVSAVVAEVAGWLIDPYIAYVAADRQVRTQVARCYRVCEVLPFQEKRLRAALRRRGIGALTIKKRGVAVSPEELRRRLALTGGEAGTLILTRTPRSAVALLVERVD